MRREVISFINEFLSVREFFLYGKCYWFAQILSIRFNGEIFYHPIVNHWGVLIDGSLYDASGEISMEGFEPWVGSFADDELYYQRLCRDCIDFWPPRE